MLYLLRRRMVKPMCALIIAMFMIVSVGIQSAKADLPSFAMGALAGVGLYLAAPLIGSGLAAAGGAVAAAGAAVWGAVAAAGTAIGGAIIAGVGALSGIVAAGGAALGAGIAAVGAWIGGAVAAIAASPITVPALLITGAAVGGYFLYKHLSNKDGGSSTTPDLPDSNDTGISMKKSDVNTNGPNGGIIVKSDNRRPVEQAPERDPNKTGGTRDASKTGGMRSSLDSSQKDFEAKYAIYQQNLKQFGINDKRTKDSFKTYQEAIRIFEKQIKNAQ